MDFEEYLESLVPVLARQERDPSAEVFWELMSGAFVWTDERLTESTAEQMGCLRAIFRVRTSLMLGQPDQRFQRLWERLETLCPTWIGFHPSRRQSSETLLAIYEAKERF